MDANYTCPDCGNALVLYANGDNGPHDDRWTCDQCGIEYPHTDFPLPIGYIRRARTEERLAAFKDRQAEERAALEAWNKWAGVSK